MLPILKRCSITPGRRGFPRGKGMDGCAIAFFFHWGEDRMLPNTQEGGWGPQETSSEQVGLAAGMETATGSRSSWCAHYDAETCHPVSARGYPRMGAEHGEKVLGVHLPLLDLGYQRLCLVLIYKVHTWATGWHHLWQQSEEREDLPLPDLAGKGVEHLAESENKHEKRARLLILRRVSLQRAACHPGRRQQRAQHWEWDRGLLLRVQPEPQRPDKGLVWGVVSVRLGAEGSPEVPHEAPFCFIWWQLTTAVVKGVFLTLTLWPFCPAPPLTPRAAQGERAGVSEDGEEVAARQSRLLPFCPWVFEAE